MKNEELREMLIKFKSDKKAIVIVAIGILGMLLVMLSESGDNQSNDNLQENSQVHLYTETELALDIEKFISNIEGAGKSKVIVTYECYEETVYIYDTDERTQADGDTDKSSEYIIIDTGDSEDGLKAKILAPKIRGVAVVCQGGNNPTTKEMIVTAISALLNISTNKISVAPMAN